MRLPAYEAVYRRKLPTYSIRLFSPELLTLEDERLHLVTASS